MANGTASKRAPNGSAYTYVLDVVPNFYDKAGRYKASEKHSGAALYYALKKLKKEDKKYAHVRLFRDRKGGSAAFVVRAKDMEKK